jgi:SRSO17 transposase
MLPATTKIATLVDTAKLRWRIERDFQDLKQEIGLDHYEGRGWRGFHHHAALSIAAYGFLVTERGSIPPQASSSGPSRSSSRRLAKPIAHAGRPLRP